ncbi:MAG: hypothetical protein J3K34DRAFT_526123 [Monoraphidium minutum]|nr:MAG: hypothetical protein J3K34DRAFT_526123 [Monoraphidium minutum]
MEEPASIGSRVPSSTATPRDDYTPRGSSAELLALALRMRRELDLKDRMLHLQTYRNTFTGPQSVAWLTSRDGGGACSHEEAVELGTRMLRAGLIKNVAHRDTYSGREGDLLKFVTAALPPRDGEGGGSGSGEPSRGHLKKLGTGFSKEIVKLGKAAAEPFKKIEKAMDTISDTISDYYYGSATGAAGGGGAGSAGASDAGGAGSPAPVAAAPSANGGGARGVGGPPSRRTSGAAPGGGGGASRGGTGGGGLRGGSSAGGGGLLTARASFKGSPLDKSLPPVDLQVQFEGLRDALSLIRLDLQQHTVLQEHMIGRFTSLQQHGRRQQLVSGLQTALAAALVSSLCQWPAWALPALALVAVAALAVASLPDPMAPFARAGRAAWRRAARALGRGAPSRACSGALGSVSSGSFGGARLGGGGGGGSAMGSGGCAALRGERSRSTKDLAGLGEDGVLSPIPEPQEPSLGGAAVFAMGSGDGGGPLGGDDDEWGGPAPEEFEDWPDAPLLLRPHNRSPDQARRAPLCRCVFNGIVDPTQPLRLNGLRIPFETDLFQGVFAIYVRHLPSTPAAMFKGRKRLTWMAVQGKFKRALPVDSVVFGQEFGKAFKNLPAPWFIDNVLLPLARKISPAIRVGSLDAPHLFSPLITASQIINVAPEGQEPDMMEAREDMRAFTRALAKGGEPLPVAARRKHFQAAKNRAGVNFDTQHVWTFHLWQEFIDYAAYVLSLSYSSYDLTQHLDGQPLQFMIKDTSTGRHLLNLSAWHVNMARALSSREPHRSRHGANGLGGREHGGFPETPLSAASQQGHHHLAQQQQGGFYFREPEPPQQQQQRQQPSAEGGAAAAGAAPVRWPSTSNGDPGSGGEPSAGSGAPPGGLPRPLWEHQQQGRRRSCSSYGDGSPRAGSFDAGPPLRAAQQAALAAAAAAGHHHSAPLALASLSSCGNSSSGAVRVSSPSAGQLGGSRPSSFTLGAAGGGAGGAAPAAAPPSADGSGCGSSGGGGGNTARSTAAAPAGGAGAAAGDAAPASPRSPAPPQQQQPEPPPAQREPSSRAGTPTRLAGAS